MSDEISITSREELEAWLEDKPPEWARVIALRAALRIFPMVFTVLDAPGGLLQVDPKRDLILQSWRAIFISSVAALGPTNKMRRAAARAGSLASFASDASDAARAASLASDASDAGRASAAAARASVSADAAYAASAAAYAASASAASHVADASAARSAAWGAVTTDCRLLEGAPDDDGSVRSLLSSPLWIDPLTESAEYATNSPEITRNAFDGFANLDWVRGSAWELVTDWYAAILPSSQDRRPHNVFDNPPGRELATQPDEFWTVTDDRSPNDILAEAAEILGWKSAQPLQPSDDVDLPATVPATLEPEWRDGHLVLPKDRVGDDFAGADVDEALIALKQVLAGFADELSGSNNIDRRTVTYLQRLAINAPSVVPSQAEFFIFAHNEKVLEAYVATAEREWDGLSAARMGAVSLQFSQTVDKFPAWRAFKKSAPDGELSAEDVDAAEALGDVLADALREGLAAEFVDGEVADAVEELAEDIPDIRSPTSEDRLVTPDVESRAFDLLESVNNTLKRVVGAALWVKGAAGQLGAHTWERIGTGIRAEYGEQCEKLGKQMVKLAFGVLKYGVPAAVGGTPLAVLLIQTFPKQFVWLEPILRLFGVG